jgi:hypothetical protein
MWKLNPKPTLVVRVGIEVLLNSHIAKVLGLLDVCMFLGILIL